MNEFLVSVCIITYNHVNFIRQAIDSVLLQEINCKWEIIIADDCSTDGTREILLEYKNKNPEINLILQDPNVGGLNNSKDLIAAAKGKYIAILEGDDYWTDPLKLKKQIEFLEANPTCSVCFHKVKVIDEFGKPYDDIFGINNGFPVITTFKDIIKRNYVPTVSRVIRNVELIKNLPGWVTKVAIPDWAILLLLTEHNNLGFIDEFMGVYRKHSAGMWSAHDYQLNIQKIINGKKIMDKALMYKYHDLFFEPGQVVEDQTVLLQYYRDKKQFIYYLKAALVILKNKNVGNPLLFILRTLKQYIQSY